MVLVLIRILELVLGFILVSTHMCISIRTGTWLLLVRLVLALVKQIIIFGLVLMGVVGVVVVG